MAFLAVLIEAAFFEGEVIRVAARPIYADVARVLALVNNSVQLLFGDVSLQMSRNSPEMERGSLRSTIVGEGECFRDIIVGEAMWLWMKHTFGVRLWVI